MNDLPTENNNGAKAEDKHPLMATLEAMQRLKTLNESLVEVVKDLDARVEMLEDGFKMAFENGAKSLEEFLARMDTEHGDSGSENSSEDRDENDKSEDNEKEDDKSEDNEKEGSTKS